MRINTHCTEKDSATTQAKNSAPVVLRMGKQEVIIHL